jgi:hypothetical protein
MAAPSRNTVGLARWTLTLVLVLFGAMKALDPAPTVEALTRVPFVGEHANAFAIALIAVEFGLGTWLCGTTRPARPLFAAVVFLACASAFIVISWSPTLARIAVAAARRSG